MNRPTKKLSLFHLGKDVIEEQLVGVEAALADLVVLTNEVALDDPNRESIKAIGVSCFNRGRDAIRIIRRVSKES